MSRARAVLATVCLLALVLGGCSDDPQPKFEPTPSVSSSSNSSAVPAPADPLETVRAWIEAENAALRTGDTSGLAALSDRPCRTCDQFIEPIQRVHDAGGYFHGGDWKLAGAKARRGSGDRRIVDAAVTIAGGETKETSSAESVRYEPDKHLLTFRLIRHGDGWLISFIGFVS